MPQTQSSPPFRPPFRPADAAPADAAPSAAERLFALSHDLMCVIGTDGYCRRVNPAFAHVLGWSADELLARPFLEFAHPDDRAPAAAAWARVVAGTGLDAFESRLRRADGAYRWLEWRATPPDDHALVYVVGRDVTERRQADEALRRSEELLHFVLDCGRMAVWDWDLRTARATYGDGVGPLLGRPRGWQPTPDDDFRTRVHPDDREAFVSESQRAFAAGVPATVQVRIDLPDGAPRWVLSHGEPQRDAGTGEVTRARGVVIDVTERVLLETRLREAQKMEAIGQLAGGIAHDFNNLLTVISGCGAIALEALPPGHVVRGDVEEMRAAAARGAQVVRQLLAFGRRQVLRPVALSLSDVLAERAPMFERMLGEGHRLELDAAPDAGPIRFDPGQLDQVLLNLVLNARDAMADAPGGTLLLRTRRARLAREGAAGAGLPPGDYVALEACDSGAGMDAATRARVFEPFFTTKRAGAGSGLGLATVHGIVAQSGGAITVHSSPGQGATFTILLPRVADDGEPARPGVPAAAAAAAREGATVLLVEDEPDVRRSVRRMLERQGHTVLEARHGRDALDVHARSRGAVDVVLTDVMMPEMDGLRLAAALRASHPDLAVVFMSGYTRDDETTRATAGAGDAFLAKPFHLDALDVALRAVLDRRRAR